MLRPGVALQGAGAGTDPERGRQDRLIPQTLASRVRSLGRTPGYCHDAQAPPSKPSPSAHRHRCHIRPFASHRLSNARDRPLHQRRQAERTSVSCNGNTRLSQSGFHRPTTPHRGRRKLAISDPRRGPSPTISSTQPLGADQPPGLRGKPPRFFSVPTAHVRKKHPTTLEPPCATGRCSAVSRRGAGANGRCPHPLDDSQAAPRAPRSRASSRPARSRTTITRSNLAGSVHRSDRCEPCWIRPTGCAGPRIKSQMEGGPQRHTQIALAKVWQPKIQRREVRTGRGQRSGLELFQSDYAQLPLRSRGEGIV